MRLQSLADWQAHIRDGCDYLRTARNGLSRPSVFNNELIFQLAAMAIERIIVGVQRYHGRMPVDHTLSGLAADLPMTRPLDAGLADRIRQIERIDDLCALTPVQRSAPSDADIHRILDIGSRVADFARQHVPWEDAFQPRGLKHGRKP